MAIRGAGPLLFLNGVTGADPKTGAPVTGPDALPEAARRVILSGDGYRDRLEAAAASQAWAALDNLERTLRGAGASQAEPYKREALRIASAAFGE